jgi:hypothetical protein
MTVALCSVVSILPAVADDILPKRPAFALYQAMLDRSPFAVATVEAAPVVAPDFARDLYVANAGRTEEGDFVTVASTTDRNLKEYLDTKGPNSNGYAITDIKWSDRMGETKVTITKDGKYATLSFNQALMSQGPQNPSQPLVNIPGIPQQQQPFMAPQPYVKPPIPLPQQPQFPQPNSAINRVRSRGLIQRNPAPTPVPAPTPPPNDDQD